MWNLAAGLVFAATVCSAYVVAWSELPHVPIKLSWLGQGRAYPILALGFLFTGALLFVNHSAVHPSPPLLLLGDACFCFVGIINWKDGWMKFAHKYLVLVALSFYIAHIWPDNKLTCMLAASGYVMEHVFSYLHQTCQDPLFFTAAAVAQYATILALLKPIIMV